MKLALKMKTNSKYEDNLVSLMEEITPCDWLADVVRCH